jgi:hypothetical protein
MVIASARFTRFLAYRVKPTRIANDPEKRATEIEMTILRRIIPATPEYVRNLIDGLLINLSHPLIDEENGFIIGLKINSYHGIVP